MNKNIYKLYTPKQVEALKCVNKDFWLLIQHGAKRTGKTISNNDMFLLELMRVKSIANKLGVKRPQYILAGNSLGTLERNVLIELANKYNLKFKFDKFNRFELFGVLVCCFGHGTRKDMERIRGMTAYGAYINEMTTGVEEVIREIFNRCSGEGARLIADTNPDSPEHYVKKDYIDKADGEKVIAIHYELDDNTFLSQRYKDNVKSTTPAGQFYDRDILGLWVNAEGTVYKDFDKKKMTRDTINKDAIVKYIAGVDWGYEHLGSIVVVGIDGAYNHILLEEHVAQYQEIDYWVEVAKSIKEKYGNITFYCDSARPEHVARFSREGFNAVNANKEILSGIEVVARLMKTNKFYILSECKQYFKEVYAYTLDKKKGKHLKENDDLLDALRYAIYSESKKDISFKRWAAKEWGNYLGKET